MKGLLIKRKLERGATVKSIRKDDGNWFTPREFEIAGGYYKSSKWKQNVYCGGRSLKWLMEQELLPNSPKNCGRKKKVGNSEVCDICQDGGTLFHCSYCFRFFHENCHLPPVDTQRKPWSCTFCRTQMFLGSQKCHRESEVLARKMGPEEQLKCEFLLLKVYCHLERNFLKKIPQDTYIEVASQCLEEIKKLNNIKKRLIEGDYSNVQKFVEDMHPIFESHMPSIKSNDSDLTEEEFKKNFKDIFGIQETN